MKQILFILMIFCLTGCYQSEWEATVMIEGQLYVTTDEVANLNVEIESNLYDTINSRVRSTQIPTRNEETNFGEIGMPYLKLDEETVYILLNNQWHVFKKDMSQH